MTVAVLVRFIGGQYKAQSQHTLIIYLFTITAEFPRPHRLIFIVNKRTDL